MARTFNAGGNTFTINNYNPDGTVNLHRSDGLSWSGISAEDMIGFGVSPDLVNAAWRPPSAGYFSPFGFNEVIDDQGVSTWDNGKGTVLSGPGQYLKGGPPQRPQLDSIFSVGPSNNQNQFQSLNQTTHPNWQQNNINDSGNGLYSMFNNQDAWNPNTSWNWGNYLNRS